MADVKMRELLEKGIKALEGKLKLATVDEREASRQVVVLSITNAEPRAIAVAKLKEREAKAVRRKVVAELMLAREALALAS